MELLAEKILRTIPPKVEYSLTEEGRKLLPVMSLLEDWGNKFEYHNQETLKND